MKANLLFLLILSVLGCKTTKEYTSAKTDIVSKVQNDIQSSSASMTTNAIKMNKVEQVFENDSSVFKETIIALSKPDTSGSQYVTTITHRKASKIKQTGKQTITAGNSTASINKNEKVKDKSVKQSKTSNGKKTVKKTERHWSRLSVGLLVLIAAALFIFKRYSGSGVVKGITHRILKFLSI